jgi:DNA mismatch repair protein MutS2
LYEFLVDIDLLSARAALADCFDGRMAEFVSDRGLLLREARHPLLALAASEAAGKALRNFAVRSTGKRSGASEEELSGSLDAEERKPGRPVKVVSSTLELLPGQRALVISGGNAGGKTVCLKTVGLITLMTLCALPTPVAAGSVLPPWINVNAFIGDEQSLGDHVSTFTAQIAHLGRIWPGLSSESLVILDEFGTGTDPSQGAALAQAVVDSIMETGAFVIAATHFPALKAYALSAKGVRAASVLFDPGTKKPLFRLVYDQVGASQALDVAREHGLPEPVLRRAEQYLLMNGEDSSALVERLNALAVAREEELTALAKERAAFSEKKSKLQEQFTRERTRLFDAVQSDARKVLADWKTAKMSHKQALKELSRIRATLIPTDARAADGPEARPEVDISALEPRQRVRHIPWKRTGVVVEVDERKKRVRLDFDGVSLWADSADIALPETGEEGGRKPGSAGKPVFAVNAGISASVLPLHLDLRGLRADVAISDLEKFLDSAIMSARDQVEVIHGRGTGVLRREIHAFLKNFSAVREFRLAPEDQGGDGVTIVELK